MCFFSVYFRVIPWLMLLLVLPSVSLLLLILPSVFFRVNPWQILLHLLSSVSLLLSFPCFSVFVRGYASSWLSFRG